MYLSYTADAPIGVSGNYWVISETSINIVAKTSVIIVCQYVDEKSYIAAKQPIQIWQIAFDGKDFPFTDEAIAKTSPIILAYKKLQDNQRFKGSKYVQ